MTEQQIPKGYKLTEVGVIPEDWEVIPLKDACTFLDEKRKPIKASDRLKIKGSYPYYGASGIIDYVDDYIFDGEFILLGEDGENILSRNLPLAFKVIGRIWVNNHAHILLPTTYFQIDFLTAYLESLDYQDYNSGTAQPKLNKKTCLSLLILKPTIEEQTAIANALSDTDTLINQLKKLITKKQTIKTATMQQLLTGKTRLPEFAYRADGSLKGTKISELGEIPEDWEVIALIGLVEITKGELITLQMITPGYVPVIAGGKKPAYFHNSANRKGTTITISSSGASAGYVALYNVPIFASDCSTISESKDYNILYIYYYLKMLQNNIYFLQSGGAQPHVNPKDLNPLKVLKNSIEEQTAIATILTEMDQEITLLETRLAKTEHIKQGMMQQLLTGKIRLL